MMTKCWTKEWIPICYVLAVIASGLALENNGEHAHDGMSMSTSMGGMAMDSGMEHTNSTPNMHTDHGASMDSVTSHPGMHGDHGSSMDVMNSTSAMHSNHSSGMDHMNSTSGMHGDHSDHSNSVNQTSDDHSSHGDKGNNQPSGDHSNHGDQGNDQTSGDHSNHGDQGNDQTSGDHSNHGYQGTDDPNSDHTGHQTTGHGLYFFFSVDSVILFEKWTTSSWQNMLGTCFGIGAIAAAYEGLKFFREWLHFNAFRQEKYSLTQQTSCCTGACACRHLFQTVLHMVQVALSYSLMMVFMTFNVWLCLAVIIGAGLGYMLWGWRTQHNAQSLDHCN